MNVDKIKVWVLMRTVCNQGHEVETLLSISFTEPPIPPDTEETCGCCWTKYWTIEREVKP